VANVGRGEDLGIALVALEEPLDVFVYCFLKVFVVFGHA
jgi:hypothetical protein